MRVIYIFLQSTISPVNHFETEGHINVALARGSARSCVSLCPCARDRAKTAY